MAGQVASNRTGVKRYVDLLDTHAGNNAFNREIARAAYIKRQRSVLRDQLRDHGSHIAVDSSYKRHNTYY